jgi:hypothetical protein
MHGPVNIKNDGNIYSVWVQKILLLPSVLPDIRFSGIGEAVIL